MTIYELHLQVPTKILSTILELVEGEGIVVTLREMKSERPITPVVSRYSGGKRNKGIRAKQLLIDLLEQRPMSRELLQKKFMERGFAATSISPILSDATRSGSIKLNESHNYVLIPQEPKDEKR